MEINKNTRSRSEIGFSHTKTEASPFVTVLNEAVNTPITFEEFKKICKIKDIEVPEYYGKHLTEDYYEGLLVLTKQKMLLMEKRAYVGNPKAQGRMWSKHVLDISKPKQQSELTLTSEDLKSLGSNLYNQEINGD